MARYSKMQRGMLRVLAMMTVAALALVVISFSALPSVKAVSQTQQLVCRHVIYDVCGTCGVEKRAVHVATCYINCFEGCVWCYNCWCVYC